MSKLRNMVQEFSVYHDEGPMWDLETLGVGLLVLGVALLFFI